MDKPRLKYFTITRQDEGREFGNPDYIVWQEDKIKQLEEVVKTALNSHSATKTLMYRLEELKEIRRIYDIQVWAAMQAKSFGLCKKCLSHAINDIRKLEEK